ILTLWRERYRVKGAGPAEMRPRFEQIEKELSVAEIPAAMRNANNEVLRKGVEKLGWRGGPLKHNRVGCQMSGFCELGCAYNAKQNGLKVIMPQAVEAGATIYADVQVRRILHHGGFVSGVEGAVLGASGEDRFKVAIRARVVVLAASAVGSAALALAS